MIAPNPNRLTEEELQAIQTYRGTLRLLWSRAPFSTIIALLFLSLILGLLIYGMSSLILWMFGRN